MCYGGCECRKSNQPEKPGRNPSAWTTEKPTAEGWYWFRRTDLPHENLGVLQVRRVKGKRGLRVWDEIDGVWEPLKQYRGEWQPVPPPEE